MPTITIEIHLGSAQRQTRSEDVELRVGDLINRCKLYYALPEQDGGELIRYGLYHGPGAERRPLPPANSLREARVQNGDELYLSRQDRPWWRAPEPAQPELPPADERPAPCQVELAQGCTFLVPPEAGVAINRDFLFRHLPQPTVARERRRAFLGLPSRLEYVSKSERGHCRLAWGQGWWLSAHKTIYIAGARHDSGARILIARATTLLLGRDGWPITIRVAT